MMLVLGSTAPQAISSIPYHFCTPAASEAICPCIPSSALRVGNAPFSTSVPVLDVTACFTAEPPKSRHRTKVSECVSVTFVGGSFIVRAHDLSFIVAVDTNEGVSERFGATPFALAPFAKMGVDAIRLDGNFGEQGDVMITRSPYGIAIELNASVSLPLDVLVERGADVHNMVVCRNFYPEPHTGLSEELLARTSRKYKGMGLPVTALISIGEEGAFGPWPVNAGLATCEDD